MKENFDHCLEKLLAVGREGGFSNNPKDPGGITNHGVTKRVWEAWVGHPVTEQDMRSLTVAQVAPLYRKKYWDAVKADDLPAGLDHCVFDCAVNGGVSRANGLLAAATAQEPSKATKRLINAFCDARQAYLQALPTFPEFGKGWTRRVSEVRLESLIMA